MIGAKINFLKKYFNTFKKNNLKITLIMILNIPKKVQEEFKNTYVDSCHSAAQSTNNASNDVLWYKMLFNIAFHLKIH